MLKIWVCHHQNLGKNGMEFQPRKPLPLLLSLDSCLLFICLSSWRHPAHHHSTVMHLDHHFSPGFLPSSASPKYNWYSTKVQMYRNCSSLMHFHTYSWGWWMVAAPLPSYTDPVSVCAEIRSRRLKPASLQFPDGMSITIYNVFIFNIVYFMSNCRGRHP